MSDVHVPLLPYPDKEVAADLLVAHEPIQHVLHQELVLRKTRRYAYDDLKRGYRTTRRVGPEYRL